MTAPLTPDQVGALMQRVALASIDPPPRLLNHGGVHYEDIDLSDPDNKLLAGQQFALDGWSIRMMRSGSSPGARLELDFDGQTVTKNFTPGQSLGGGFRGFKVKRAASSARTGFARLAISTSPLAWAGEDFKTDVIQPGVLLGALDATGAPLTYVTVAEDTDPSGASPAGAYDFTGWNTLAYLVDGNSNAGNFTTADVVFFCDPAYAGNWHEQGTQSRISIPDADTSGFRFRAFMRGVAGTGRECPAVRNLFAAARTGLGFIVVGVN
jgi:hypothetical protein